MESFDYREVDNRPLENRFPRDAIGSLHWGVNLRGDFTGPREWVSTRSAAREAKQRFQVPRVFVSHKRQDLADAARIASWVREEGCYTWLDAENLANGLFDPLRIAGFIEMALLNSTHVIAIMTPNTKDSTWVPYEYGRVKEDLPLSDQAASWLRHDFTNTLPEYLYLGTVVSTEEQVRAWTNDQKEEWHTKLLAGWQRRP
jgi:hypothetical protein